MLIRITLSLQYKYIANRKLFKLLILNELSYYNQTNLSFENLQMSKIFEKLQSLEILKIDKYFYYIAYLIVVLNIASLAMAYFQYPMDVVLASVTLTLLAIFILVMKILTENKIYLFLKQSVWGGVILFLILASYTSFSYVWAEREVNEIFLVDPNNFKWTLSFLTIVFFLKFIAKTFLYCSLIYFSFYTIYWLFLFATNKNVKFLRGIIFFLLINFSIGSLMAPLEIIENNTKNLAKYFSLKTDFSTYYRCTGNSFKNVEGVIFLSSNSVLVAEKANGIQNEWTFEQVECITD